MDVIWETWITLCIFYIKMSYGYWKKTWLSLNNKNTSICKWDSWSEIFLVSSLASKPFIYFRRRFGIAWFWNVYFNLPISIFFFSCFNSSNLSSFMKMSSNKSYKKKGNRKMKVHIWKPSYTNSSSEVNEGFLG